MNQTTEIYSYIQSLIDILRDEVDAAFEEEGMVCGHCLSKQFFDDNQTRILSELYQITKGNPVEAMNALMKFSVFNKAVIELTENLGIATFELNEEELFALNEMEQKN